MIGNSVPIRIGTLFSQVVAVPKEAVVHIKDTGAHGKSATLSGGTPCGFEVVVYM